MTQQPHSSSETPPSVNSLTRHPSQKELVHNLYTCSPKRMPDSPPSQSSDVGSSNCSRSPRKKTTTSLEVAKGAESPSSTPSHSPTQPFCSCTSPPILLSPSEIVSFTTTPCHSQKTTPVQSPICCTAPHTTSQFLPSNAQCCDPFHFSGDSAGIATLGVSSLPDGRRADNLLPMAPLGGPRRHRLHSAQGPTTKTSSEMVQAATSMPKQSKSHSGLTKYSTKSGASSCHRCSRHRHTSRRQGFDRVAAAAPPPTPPAPPFPSQGGPGEPMHRSAPCLAALSVTPLPIAHTTTRHTSRGDVHYGSGDPISHNNNNDSSSSSSNNSSRTSCGSVCDGVGGETVNLLALGNSAKKENPNRDIGDGVNR